jgi:hypothetical protein
MLLKEVFAPRVYDENFDTNLAGRQQRGQWNIRLNPKFGDFFGDEYVRFPIGVRYNFSKWYEMVTDFGLYFGNPFDDGNGIGFYEWRVGGKYSWLDVGGSGYNIATGINATMPIADPPPELSDGYARYNPYISVSHRLKNSPNWMAYFNLTYQFVEETPFRADPIQPQPKDRIFLRPGVIHYPGGHYRYSLELEYRTNALDFRGPEYKDSLPPVEDRPDGFRRATWILATEEVHEVIIRPGITWFPTRSIRNGVRIPGNWDLSLVLDIPVIEETGEDFGVNLRFRWYYDYRAFVMKDLPELIRKSTQLTSP